MSAEKSQEVVSTFTAIWRTVAQLESLDNHHDYGDYQEVETGQPHSVLDIYRQAASIRPSSSPGPSALEQLTASVSKPTLGPSGG